MDKRVLVTRRIYQQGLDLLRSRVGQVIVYEEDKGMPVEELCEQAKGVNGILCMLSDKIDARVMEAAGPSLQCVSTLSVGFDHVDLKECKARNIRVGNTPGVLTNATADLTMSLLLATARLIPQAAQEAKTGGWGTWKPMWLCGTELADKTCGIIGLGRIGYAVAKRLKAFEVGKLLYTGRTEKEDPENLGTEFVDMERLLTESDIIVATCALTEATTNIFNAETFAKMKDTAILVNTARGACVDQDALVTALKTGQIRAAGLDVTTPEPLPTDHELFKLDNCVILPHIGSATAECRTVMSVMAAENLIAGMTDQPMPAEVNP
eukprot:m.354149 g.354149  ORF g.354149 m.354149 type:complete len:323 (-) comp16940_c0_seq1:1473-2441(-)